jgi:hypothetical protein
VRLPGLRIRFIAAHYVFRVDIYGPLPSAQIDEDPETAPVIRQNPGRIETVDFLRSSARHSAVMIVTILRLLSLILTAFRLQSELALENLALRQQLAVLNRRYPRPKLRRSDRVFWLLLSRSWERWKETLVIVKP